MKSAASPLDEQSASSIHDTDDGQMKFDGLKTYQYSRNPTPDYIRWLEIDKSAPWALGLTYTMTTLPITDAQSTGYNALSYVWGTDRPTSEIGIDGKLYYVRSSQNSSACLGLLSTHSRDSDTDRR